jgi:hypothetical protein
LFNEQIVMTTAEALAILGLTPQTATPSAVKKAYRRLARTWHPDLHEQDPTRRRLGEARFKEINAAYQALQGFRPIRPKVTEPAPGRRRPPRRRALRAAGLRPAEVPKDDVAWWNKPLFSPAVDRVLYLLGALRLLQLSAHHFFGLG